jgi:hypothetical protein
MALTARPAPAKPVRTRVPNTGLRTTPDEAAAIPTDELFRRALQSADAAPEDVALLGRVDAVRDRLGKDGQDLAREQALRVHDGLPVDATYELRTLLAMHERGVRD